MWERLKLKDVGILTTGSTPKTSVKGNYGNDIPFVKPADFSGNGSLRYDNEGLSEAGAIKSRITRKNSVLMVCIGATIGKVGYCDRDVATNQQTNSLTPTNQYNHKFIYYQMLSDRFQRELMNSSAQATLPIINKSKWGELELFFPPLEEQRAIVAKLDAAFAEIDKAKAVAQRNVENSEALFQVFIDHCFSENSFDTRKLDDVSSILNGFAFKSTDFNKVGGTKCIKITNVGIKEFVTKNQEYLPEEFQSSHNKVCVKAGSIVFALTRTIISGGLKVAIVPVSYHNSLLNQRVAAVEADSNYISNEFLYYYFSSSFVTEYVLDHVNTLMQPNLSISDLRSIPIPIPGDEEQRILEDMHEMKIATLSLYNANVNKVQQFELLRSALLTQELSSQRVEA